MSTRLRSEGMPYQEAVQALEALYAQLPRLRRQRLCEACCGPIGMSALEWQRLERTTHGLPKAKTTQCPLLRGNTCSAYKVRPMICRLWGLLPSMACPFGCEPERWLTEAKGDQFLHEAEAIARRLFPTRAPRHPHTEEVVELLYAREADLLSMHLRAAGLLTQEGLHHQTAVDAIRQGLFGQPLERSP